MKTTIHPTIIYRVPKFPITADLKVSWDELKEAIRFASSDFYTIIEKVPAHEIDRLPSTVQRTIWKYFNRAKFRATPYGTFAAIGLADITGNQESKGIVIEGTQIVHRFRDWGKAKEISSSLTEVTAKNWLLFANSTYYSLAGKIRYIYYDQGVFQLSEIDHSPALETLLQKCATPLKVSSLLASMPEQPDDELLVQIEYMLENQLLLHSGQPNIIGQDFFSRCKCQLQPGYDDYVITERKARVGSLERDLFRHVPALIEKLRQLLNPQSFPALDSFIARFARRFELKEVPIMLALDPEAGVGYDELEQVGSGEGLVTGFIPILQAQNTDLFRESLIATIIGVGQQMGRSIDLEQIAPVHSSPINDIPNTISLMCLVGKDCIQIENFGGVSANALAGRFTLANDPLLEHCRELAAIEQSANPDVLFFDIAYHAEGRVDNINRRKAIYDLQLSLLEYDTSESPLILGDLLLSVRGTELILRSKRSGKRLVPRLSSAYNYNRSDLSVFRLLCDLQNQQLTTSLNFSLRALLPGLDYYPEIRFRNIIISPRAWRLRGTDNIASPTGMKRQFDIAGGKAPRYVRSGKEDQTICFDLENTLDLEMLYLTLQKEKGMLLEEVLIAPQSMIKDQEGSSYLGEFLLAVTHQRNIYKAASPAGNETNLNEVFLPGGEWLYFEIYCHPYRADSLLLEKIAGLIEGNKELLDTWFFIRFNEGGNHLRLRLKTYDPSSTHILTKGLTGLLQEEVQSGIISDIRLCTYRPEIARYAAVGMEVVEDHFSKDSLFVLELLAEDLDEFSRYRLCVELFELLVGSKLLGEGNGISIAEQNSAFFNREHSLKPEDFRKLNLQYKEFRNRLATSPAADHGTAATEFRRSFINVLTLCPESSRAATFTDLLHMHINRLFADHQRTHEMLFYYFLLKELKRKAAVSRL